MLDFLILPAKSRATTAGKTRTERGLVHIIAEVRIRLGIAALGDDVADGAAGTSESLGAAVRPSALPALSS